jgi:hypothetical protein
MEISAHWTEKSITTPAMAMAAEKDADRTKLYC